MTRIYDLLSKGRENAVPRHVLAEMLGRSEREVRRLVERERLEGLPILTDTEHGGYFIPSCHEETERFVRSMRSRGVKVLQVAQAVEATMLEEAGQLRFEGWGTDA